jgi:cytochrome c oxidase subunit 2
VRRYFLIGGLVAALVVLVGVGFLAWIGTGRGLVPVDPGSGNAEGIRDVYVYVGAFVSLVFLAVTVPLALFVIRFRSKTGDRTVEGPQIRGNSNLELAWTVAPVLILAAIAVFVFLKIGGIRGPVGEASASDRLEIAVEGRQFYWQFTYPNGVIAIDRLRVPVDRNVRLTLRSPESDVIHSFWVPALAGKVDAIPGVTNHLAFRAKRVGEYEGKCAELCGLQHSAMLATVEVVPQGEYERWLADEESSQSAGEGDLGQQLFDRVCAKCHFAAPEYAPNIATSPLLGDAQAIETIVREGRLRMPAVGRGWSDRQVEALTDYLDTIAPGGGSDGG